MGPPVFAGTVLYPEDVWPARFVRLAAKSRRSVATTVGCGKPEIGNVALKGRVISAPLNPTDWAPMVSQTCAATIMQSAGATPSCSHAYRYTAGAGLNARQAS